MLTASRELFGLASDLSRTATTGNETLAATAKAKAIENFRVITECPPLNLGAEVPFEFTFTDPGTRLTLEQSRTRKRLPAIAGIEPWSRLYALRDRSAILLPF